MESRLVVFRCGFSRSEGGRKDLRVGGCVRIVADGAGVPHAGAPGEIPVASHAAVRAVLVVAVLWAVALCAKHLCIRKGDTRAVS